MQLVFVRHAHRDVSDRTRDNGLSENGREPVEDLIDDLESGVLPESKLFWSSPKLRCQETLKPMCDWSEGEFKIEPLLDEHQPHESQKQFHDRIESLLERAKSTNQTIYLCSHGDLIPIAVESLVGIQVDLGKGEAIILQNDDGRWEMR